MHKTLKQRQRETGRTLALNGAAWRRLRASVLAEQPLCAECAREGRHEPATEVDHRDNDPSNNDRDNLIGRCKPHHSRKTQRDLGKAARYGCDMHGMPSDPMSPWNKACRLLQKSPATERCEPRPLPRVIAKCQP